MALVKSSYVTVVGRGGAAFDHHTVVWLRGEFDLTSVPALAEALARAIATDDSDVFVDLARVQFMDASTVGVLVRARALLANRSRCLWLHAPSGLPLRVLEVCDLMSLVIQPTSAFTAKSTTGEALGTWVAVPAERRVRRRRGASAPSPKDTSDPARARVSTVADPGSG
jgi:anti-anti-sigma factor